MIRQIRKPINIVLLLVVAFELLYFCASVYAADTKLTGLTVLASADCSDDEMIYIVDEPNGVPVSKKIGRYEFLLGWAGSANITTLGTIATGTWNALFSNDIVKDTSIDWGSGAGQVDLADIPGGVGGASNFDLGGSDFELPQASPAVPDADGEVELDFTDGTFVVQHGSAHAELAASTDVVIGKLIKSFSGTIITPDLVNDVITVKAINSIEYPHGIVITAVYLGVSSDTGYELTVQNFDDFDTINAANPTIDTVTYAADTTGEIIDSTPTYATIAAGQIIMISIPATDVDWIHFEIYYYEPAA